MKKRFSEEDFQKLLNNLKENNGINNSSCETINNITKIKLKHILNSN